jgi:hypothetical protein
MLMISRVRQLALRAHLPLRQLALCLDWTNASQLALSRARAGGARRGPRRDLLQNDARNGRPQIESFRLGTSGFTVSSISFCSVENPEGADLWRAC